MNYESRGCCHNKFGKLFEVENIIGYIRVLLELIILIILTALSRRKKKRLSLRTTNNEGYFYKWNEISAPF